MRTLGRIYHEEITGCDDVWNLCTEEEREMWEKEASKHFGIPKKNNDPVGLYKKASILLPSDTPEWVFLVGELLGGGTQSDVGLNEVLSEMSKRRAKSTFNLMCINFEEEIAHEQEYREERKLVSERVRQRWSKK